MATVNRQSLKLEDLLAFNDELAGVIRAGLPLDLGLRQIAESSLGGIARLSHRLQERVAVGVSLEQALRDEGDHLPSIYVAIVEAGLRVGRLPEALETLSALGQTILDLHRRSIIALIYPLIVLVIAYGSMLVFVGIWIPQIIERFYEGMHAAPGPIFHVMNWFSKSLWLWSWLAPLVGLFLVALLSRLFSPGSSASPSGTLLPSSVRRFAWLPWMRGAIENLDRATFTKLLAMLVKHETPLHEAVVLASYSTGNPSLMIASNRLAELLRGGQSLSVCVQNIDNLPPFMRSMMAMGDRHHALDTTLWQTSDIYQRRAERQVDFASSVLPILLTCGIGGVATLVYAITVFGPVWELYRQLAQPLAVM